MQRGNIGRLIDKARKIYRRQLKNRQIKEEYEYFETNFFHNIQQSLEMSASVVSG